MPLRLLPRSFVVANESCWLPALCGFILLREEEAYQGLFQSHGGEGGWSVSVAVFFVCELHTSVGGNHTGDLAGKSFRATGCSCSLSELLGWWDVEFMGKL